MRLLTKIFTMLAVLGILGLPLSADDGNITDGCITDYAPDVDYFPDKAVIEDASGFSVAYFNHYKVVTVTNAYDGAPQFAYVLVQCGTPAPDADNFPADTQFIEVPAGRVIAMSTTQIPHLAELGLLDHLAGMDSLDYVGNPIVREMIDAGDVVAVGYGANVSVEAVLDTEADLVMTFGYDPVTDAHPVLRDAGIFTALNSEYREATPLGRAEWIKFTSLFYNAEARANAAYDVIREAYLAARELAASIPVDERPAVLWNTFSIRSDAWIVPGGQTYNGRLILDAGGVLALTESTDEGNLSLSFEAVYDGAHAADFWLPGVQGLATLDDLVALDSRYADFSAVVNGAVWSNDRSINAVGGNTYWELGVTQPHLLLQDLVAILHPHLLPDHEFNFFRQIPGA